MTNRRDLARALGAAALATAMAAPGISRADTVAIGTENELVQATLADLAVESLRLDTGNFSSPFAVTYSAVTQSDAWTGTFAGALGTGAVTGSMTGTIDEDPTWTITGGFLKIGQTPFAFSGSITSTNNMASVNFQLENVSWMQNPDRPMMFTPGANGSATFSGGVIAQNSGFRRPTTYFSLMITVTPGGAPNGRDKITSTLTPTTKDGTPLPKRKPISNSGSGKVTFPTAADGDADVSVVPEPSAVVLFAVGALGLLVRARGRRGRAG